jgi:hypothetical protein
MIGLAIRLNGWAPCKCGSVTAVIGSSSGPHHAAIECATCGRWRAWMSTETAGFINSIIDHVGRPSEPTIVRKGSANG